MENGTSGEEGGRGKEDKMRKKNSEDIIVGEARVRWTGALQNQR